jgi:hypothetical protein
MLFRYEADTCRRQAAEYANKPEGPFLLRVARAFDELAVGETARSKASRLRRAEEA